MTVYQLRRKLEWVADRMSVIRGAQGGFMIEFKYKKEVEIFSYYANYLNNKEAINLIAHGSVKTKEEVKSIAKFYWQVVDLSIEEEKNNSVKFEEMEKWLERIYTSLHIYFNNMGMEESWESEIP